jgi:hypothetical protein
LKINVTHIGGLEGGSYWAETRPISLPRNFGHIVGRQATRASKKDERLEPGESPLFLQNPSSFLC